MARGMRRRAVRLTDEQRRYRAVTEREWQRQVIDALTLHNWTIYHTHDSRRSNPGWPDLFAVHPAGDCFAAELKRETGKVTPEQRH